jgi:hypothetical protein
LNSCVISVTRPLVCRRARSELVLEGRVLEIFEIQRLGMLHEIDARFVRQAVRQQAVDQHHDPADDVGDGGERELGQDQHDHAIELAAAEPLRQRRRPIRQLRQPHDVVDDQLADVENGDRQQRPRQAQQQRPEGERWADPPHHDNERPQRAQGDEPRSQRAGAGGSRLSRPIAGLRVMLRHRRSSSTGKPAGRKCTPGAL